MYLDPGFDCMLVQVIVVIAAASSGILFSLKKRFATCFPKIKTLLSPLTPLTTNLSLLQKMIL